MAIIINPKIQMPGVMSKLQKLEDKLKAIKKAAEDANEPLAIMAGLVGQIANGSRMIRTIRAPRGGGGSASAYSNQYSSPIGPKIGYFKQYNSPIGPITAQQHRAQQAKLRKPPKVKIPASPGQALMSALMRSRVSASGGLMPLVGDLVKVLGTIAPELAVAATVLLIGVKALTMALEVAMKFLDAQRTAMVRGGGGMQTANATNLLGQTFGINTGGIGKNLMSGYGPLAAGGAGVNPFGGPFGDMNYNEKGLKVLDYIRNAGSFGQARQRAEMAGSPDAASVYGLSSGTYGLIRHPADMVPGANVGIAGNFKANLAVFGNNLMQIVSILGGPIMGILGPIFQVLNTGFKILSPILKAIGFVLDLIVKPLQWLADILSWLASKLGLDQDDQKKALDKNTDSLDNLSKAIQDGINGGGANAASASPSRWNPNNPHGGNPNMPYGIPV